MANESHRFSGENQEIEHLAEWYRTNISSIENYKIHVLEQIKNKGDAPKEFLHMNLDEVEVHFESLFREAEYSFCLNLIASIEAKFRMDYIVRATEKKKDELSRKFREIYKEYEDNVGLEAVILDEWKSYYPEFKAHISAYIGALKYRHWLAHGRYWKPKLGRTFDSLSVYPICEGIIQNVFRKEKKQAFANLQRINTDL